MVSLHLAVICAAVGGGETGLLAFQAKWCGACRDMQPVVRQLAASGLPVQAVDIDAEAARAQRFGVTSVPCFVAVKDGREVERIVGGTEAGRLVEMLRRAGISTTDVAGAKRNVPKSAAIPATAALTPIAKPPHAALSRGVGEGEDERSVHDKLLAATVRLRIEDANGRSTGSGTIVDARDGAALILTCGHVFRSSGGKGPVSVDLFGPSARQSVAGEVLHYDLMRDLGLVCIEAPPWIAPVRIAPAGYSLREGQTVLGAGCSHSADPTVIESHIMAINKFLGPQNLQAAGQPVEGRSGGGLFSTDGLLIGVCNAADPTDDGGLYASLASIHEWLDEQRLAFVYPQSPPTAEGSKVAPLESDPPAMAATMPVAALSSSTHDSVEATETGAAQVSPPVPTKLVSADNASGVANRSPGAEVICVIRRLGHPQAKSEVIVLEHASADLLARLAAEQRLQPARNLTSERVIGSDGAQRGRTPTQARVPKPPAPFR